MIDFKSYYPGYDETTVKASIYCGVSDVGVPGLNTKAGYLAFMTADATDLPSERMRIERSGNVGIGTTSPGQKLEIKTGTSYDGLILNNEDGGLLFKAARSSAKGKAYMGLYDGNTSAPQSRVIFRNDDDSYINTGGNVGIGTTDPKGLLHIYGNTHSSYSYSGLLRLVSSSSNGSGSGNWGLLNFPDSNAASSANENYYMIGRGHQYSDNCLTLHVPTDGSIDMTSTGAVRMMKIQGNGNVGIGTTSPADRLHIGTPGTTVASYALRIGAWNNSTNGFRFYQNANADLQIDYMSGSSIQTS